jgi:hypothetical protein
VKLVASTLLVLFSYSILCAQTATENPSGAEVVKSGWSKVRIGWERDPFGGPLENFDEMRSRTRNERRVAMGGGERAKRDAKVDEANIAAQRDKAPPRYFFVYKAKVKNNSTSAIVELDWDYIFYERGTENELGRREFTTDEQIGPGKTRELTVTTLSPPTRTVSLSQLNLGEHDQFTERIQLIRIKYADGRVWPPQ